MATDLRRTIASGRTKAILACWACRSAPSDWTEKFQSTALSGPGRPSLSKFPRKKHRRPARPLRLRRQTTFQVMKKTSPIRILICDDHFIVRMGLTAMINAETDMEIVGEATDGGEAVAMFARFKPDVMLLDIRMPVVNGVDVATTIRKQNKNARILILSALNGDEDIHKALEAGVAGYVLKDATEESLVPAIRAVAAGEKWIPQEVANRLAARKSFEE